MDGALIRQWFALFTLGAVMACYVYAHFTSRPFRIVPALLATSAIVTAIELLPSVFASWEWAVAIGFAVMVGSAAGYRIARKGADGGHLQEKSVRLIREFTSDRRLLFVAAATLVAVFVTALFGRWSKAGGASSFWASYYASWTANLAFFALLGVAGIVVSIYRPEKDEFSRRVRILFGGRQDAAVDYITETIRSIGYYAEEVVRTYRIQEFDHDRKAARIRVEHRTVTRNFYDDLSATDRAAITLIPDPLNPSMDQVGELLSFSVGGVNRLQHPMPIKSGVEFTHVETIEIPSGGSSTVEVVSQAWYSLSETHQFEPNRFAKVVRIEVVYEGNTPGMSVPVTVDAPHAESLRLGYLKKLKVADMVNKPPGKAAFAFRLGFPNADA
ncbi:hypothetical protein [Methylobacterium sp. AMS5]|uniref:hypothetical protein n=1 Tax=Methylobacterium sp. AMS5 TaxID=925818 RepID=UPI00118758E6|nr:hypothetical protein [Methylobacterium sp. AMS5]